MDTVVVLVIVEVATVVVVVVVVVIAVTMFGAATVRNGMRMGRRNCFTKGDKYTTRMVRETRHLMFSCASKNYARHSPRILYASMYFKNTYIHTYIHRVRMLVAASIQSR